MFKVRADFSEPFEVKANLKKVRAFFTDIKNLIDLMPSIESIHVDSKGIIHWKIRVVVPFVGSFTEKFSVFEVENSDERVEWSPAEDERFNLLRYSAEYLPKGKNKTLVQFSQNIELRRDSSADLHLLAGLAGENIISSEMTKGITEMMHVFLDKAAKRLER